jgi:hypothetical protein
VLITSLVAAGLVIVYRFVCIWDNKQRDKAGVMEGFDHAYEDDSTDRKVSGKNSVKFSGGELLADEIHVQNPQFRYII